MHAHLLTGVGTGVEVVVMTAIDWDAGFAAEVGAAEVGGGADENGFDLDSTFELVLTIWLAEVGGWLFETGAAEVGACDADADGRDVGAGVDAGGTDTALLPEAALHSTRGACQRDVWQRAWNLMGLTLLGLDHHLTANLKSANVHSI